MAPLAPQPGGCPSPACAPLLLEPKGSLEQATERLLQPVAQPPLPLPLTACRLLCAHDAAAQLCSCLDLLLQGRGTQATQAAHQHPLVHRCAAGSICASWGTLAEAGQAQPQLPIAPLFQAAGARPEGPALTAANFQQLVTVRQQQGQHSSARLAASGGRGPLAHDPPLLGSQLPSAAAAVGLQRQRGAVAQRKIERWLSWRSCLDGQGLSWRLR